MKIIHTDAGRSVGGERLDCSVRAVAIALQVPYALAHEKLRALGRQDGCVLYHCSSVFMDGLGLIQRPDLSCRTVANALGDMATGRFIVRVYAHVFAVVDGFIHDLPGGCPSPRTNVEMVYEVPA